MDRKTNYPDSDESARKMHQEFADDPLADTDTDDAALTDVQTSTKSGKHSSVEKQAAALPEFRIGRGASPVDGAFGSGEE